jgi:hypothetical protein
VELNHDQLVQVSGASLQRWAFELARRVGPDDASRLLLAATIAAMEASYGIEDTASMLRQAAAGIEALAGPVGHA